MLSLEELETVYSGQICAYDGELHQIRPRDPDSANKVIMSKFSR